MTTNNCTISGHTFEEVYSKALDAILNNCTYVTTPRGLKVHECINMQLVINNPSNNLFTNTYRSIPLRYLKDELLLYFAGRHDAAGFVKASKAWDSLKTEDGRINSAYGHLIFNKHDAKSGMSQWDWAKTSLINDIYTRQSILHFNRPEHQYLSNKDFTCTMYGIFHIRNNRLFFTISMRSQDIRKGTQFDIPFFTMLHQLMLVQLKQNESFKDLTLGTYTHFCNSFHLYETDFDIAQNMLNATWDSAKIPMPTINPVLHPDILRLSFNKDAYISEEAEKDVFVKWLIS